MLKERFYWRDLVGVTLAVLGAVTVVLSASSANPQVRDKRPVNVSSIISHRPADPIITYKHVTNS